MTTYSVLAPTGVAFSARSGTVYTPDANNVISGVALVDVRDLITAGCIPLGAAVNDASAWNTPVGAPQVLAAAGSTQLGGGAITSSYVVVTVTASTEGVLLKAIATGAVTRVVVPGAIGVKVYPPKNFTLDALSTNTAVALVAGKGSFYMQTSATKFVTLNKGA